MIIDSIVEDVTKVIGTASTVITLFLVWKKALPKIEQIHEQTNSLSLEVDPAAAAAAKLVLEAAAERAEIVLAAAAENAKGNSSDAS